MIQETYRITERATDGFVHDLGEHATKERVTDIIAMRANPHAVSVFYQRFDTDAQRYTYQRWVGTGAQWLNGKTDVS